MSGILMVVKYSDHHLNTIPTFIWASEHWTKFSPVFKWHSNTRPLAYRTTSDHLNTGLVGYSDPPVHTLEFLKGVKPDVETVKLAKLFLNQNGQLVKGELIDGIFWHLVYMEVRWLFSTSTKRLE